MLWVIFITYLDDLGWAIHPDCTPAHKKIIMDCIRNTFLSAGWVLSPTKCVFESGVTSLALLGFLISTTPILTIDLSTQRKTKLLELLDVAIAAPATTLILRAKICGGLQSGELSLLGPSVTLYLRYNYLDMSSNGLRRRQGFNYLAHPPYPIPCYHGGVDTLADTPPRQYRNPF